MASKNMFEVLKRDESDDETQEKKPTKHQQRAEDKGKREATGDRVAKDNYHSRNAGDSKPAKDGYDGSGKREYDRRSGTGTNAHNKYEKKSGGGKGNWGKEGEEGEQKEGAEVQEEAPEDQGPPPQSLEDYMKEQGGQMDLKMSDEKSGPKTTSTTEKGMHVLKKKEHDWLEANDKNKNVDGIHMSKATNIEGAEQLGYQGNNRRPQGDNRQGGKPHNKGGKSKKLGNDDFPALG